MANCMINDASSSLVWPEHNRLVSERLHQLYNTGQLVDVAVMSGHNQVFAHRAILAAASPVLLAQLQHNTGPYVQIHLDNIMEGCTVQEMHALVEFIYCGEVCVPQHRLSIFLNIARQLQLIGFNETTQRAVVAPSRAPLHVLALPEPQSLPTPSLAAPDLQTFLPQLPIAMATFPITDAQPTVPPQLLESEMIHQDDQYMSDNYIPENTMANIPVHGKYLRPEPTAEPVKYCEQFKSDSYNLRNLTGSISNATFSDLCATDPDLGLIFLGENRSLNTSFRQVFPETSDNCSSLIQENSYPKDYSQGTLKIPPLGLNEESVEASSLAEHEGLGPVSSNINVDWPIVNNVNVPVADSVHSNNHCGDIQQYQIENSSSSSSTGELEASSGISSVPPATMCQSSISHVSGNCNSVAAVTATNFWVAGGECGGGGGCNVGVDGGSHHKWCMPDETSDLPELLDCSHHSHNSPWGGTGRLKVKSSIGGVSLQDLSRANIQQINDRNENSAESVVTANESSQSAKTPDLVHPSKKTADAAISESDVYQTHKTSGGKLIVRTDIETLCYSDSSSNFIDSVNQGGASLSCMKSIGKTASISVVPSEELLDTRHLRDANASGSCFNKLSVVPEQQLLETNHLNNSLQDIVNFDVRPQRSDDVLRIKLKKLPTQENLSTEQSRSLSEAQVTHDSESESIVSNSFLNLPTLPTGNLLSEIRTPTQVLNTSLDGDSDLVSDTEEVLVLRENTNEVVQVDQENADAPCVEVVEQENDEIFNNQQDIEEDLQVILTSSHQHHLYHPHYHQSPQMEPVYHDTIEQCEEITPVKDTAKAQWEMLHQEENRKNISSVVKHSVSAPYGNELKVKKCLLNSSPSSRSQSPDGGYEAVEVVDGTEDCSSGRASVSSDLLVLSANPVAITSSRACSSLVPLFTDPQLTDSFNCNYITTQAIDSNPIQPPNNLIKSCTSVSTIPTSNVCNLYGIQLSSSNTIATSTEVRVCDNQPSVSNVQSSNIFALSNSCNNSNSNILITDERQTLLESPPVPPENYTQSLSQPCNKPDYNPSINYCTTNSASIQPACINNINENSIDVILSTASQVYNFNDTTPTINLTSACTVVSSSNFESIPLASDLKDSNTLMPTDVSRSPVRLSGITELEPEKENECRPLKSPDDISQDFSSNLQNDMEDFTSHEVVSESSPKQENTSEIGNRDPIVKSKTLKIKEDMNKDKIQDDKQPTPSSVTFSIKCGQCQCVLESERKLYLHARAHYATRPVCCVCDRTLKSVATLRKHLAIHLMQHSHDKGFKCSECSSVYSQRCALVRHLASRHQLSIDGAPLTTCLQCHQCSFTTLAQHKMKAHMLIHSTTKIHKCPHCSYRNNIKTNYTKHLRTHTNEKPYVCETCGFNAITASILSRHKRSHTGVKPYSCPRCNKQYADGKRLRDHLLQHDNLKPFMCHVCAVAFRRKDNLQTHLRKLHLDDSSAGRRDKHNKLHPPSSGKSPEATKITKNNTTDKDVAIPDATDALCTIMSASNERTAAQTVEQQLTQVLTSPVGSLTAECTAVSSDDMAAAMTPILPYQLQQVQQFNQQEQQLQLQQQQHQQQQEQPLVHYVMQDSVLVQL